MKLVYNSPTCLILSGAFWKKSARKIRKLYLINSMTYMDLLNEMSAFIRLKEVDERFFVILGKEGKKKDAYN